MRVKLEEMEADVIEVYKERGIEVVEDVDIDQFKELMYDIHEKYADQNEYIRETVDMVREIYEKRN